MMVACEIKPESCAFVNWDMFNKLCPAKLISSTVPSSASAPDKPIDNILPIVVGYYMQTIQIDKECSQKVAEVRTKYGKCVLGSNLKTNFNAILIYVIINENCILSVNKSYTF